MLKEAFKFYTQSDPSNITGQLEDLIAKHSRLAKKSNMDFKAEYFLMGRDQFARDLAILKSTRPLDMLKGAFIIARIQNPLEGKPSTWKKRHLYCKFDNGSNAGSKISFK